MKKVLSVLLKGLLILIGILLIGFVVLKLKYNEDLPQGTAGKAADDLAYSILDAINYEAFKNTKEIHWTFRGVNRYEWQLQQDIVDVYWTDKHVTLHTSSPNESLAYQSGQQITGDDKQDAIDYGIKNFNNDSFWLVAPFKIFDPGTQREIIKEDGQQKLLVQYTSGGSTPGDAYVWEVDKNYRPVAFKMWVSIIPFDGLEAEWSNWQMTEGDFPLPESRSVWGLEIPISEVKIIR